MVQTPNIVNYNNGISLLKVAVVVRNDVYGLSRLLRSLARSAKDSGPLSVLIIDNDSTVPINCDELRSQFPNLHLQLRRRRRNSMCEARQEALVNSDTPWVAFLDSDCVVSRSWLRRSLDKIKTLEGEPEVWAWSGPILNRGRSWLDQCIRVLSLPFVAHGPIAAPQTVKHIPTCGIVYRREAVLMVGGFPLGFDRVGEDLILSKIILQNGGKILLCPQPQIIHHQRQNFWQWLMRMERYGFAQGRVSYHFPSHLTDRRVLPLVFFISTPTLGIFSPKFLLAMAALGLVIWLTIGPRFAQKWQKPIGGGLIALSVFMYGLGFFRGLVAK